MPKTIALRIGVTGTKNLEKQGVVEIDAVELKDGKEGEHFHRVINSNGRPISRIATQFHHLSNNQKAVKEAEPFNTVALDFLKFVKDADVILQVAWVHHVLNNGLRAVPEEEYRKEFPEDKYQHHLADHCHSVNYTTRMFKALHPEAKLKSCRGGIPLGEIANFYGVNEESETGKLVKVIQEMTQEKAARAKAALPEAKGASDTKHQPPTAVLTVRIPTAAEVAARSPVVTAATQGMFADRPRSPVLSAQPVVPPQEKASMGMQPGH